MLQTIFKGFGCSLYRSSTRPPLGLLPMKKICLMKLKRTKEKKKELKLICSVLFVLHARLLPVLAALIKSCTSLCSTNDFYSGYTAHLLHISTTHTYCGTTQEEERSVCGSND